MKKDIGSSKLTVSGGVDKNFKPEFDKFVSVLNSVLVGFAFAGNIRNITIKFRVIEEKDVE